MRSNRAGLGLEGLCLYVVDRLYRFVSERNTGTGAYFWRLEPSTSNGNSGAERESDYCMHMHDSSESVARVDDRRTLNFEVYCSCSAEAGGYRCIGNTEGQVTVLVENREDLLKYVLRAMWCGV